MAVATNEHTGAKIKSKVSSQAYLDNWDKIFKKKDTEVVITEDLASENGDYSCEAIVKLMDEGYEVLSVKPLGKI